MGISKSMKSILLCLAYAYNLFFAFCLWLCGQNGNIMLGIIFIACYRLSLWFTPLLVTAICWIPLRHKVPLRTKLLFNFVQLLFCGMLYVVCFCLFGNWF